MGYSFKRKKRTTITNEFQNSLNESNPKKNRLWLENGSRFYNRSMKSFLQNNDTEMYSMK